MEEKENCATEAQKQTYLDSDRKKRVLQSIVPSGQVFLTGVGNDGEKVTQRAPKNEPGGLQKKENMRPETEAAVTKVNHVSCFNEEGQKNKMTKSALLSTRKEPSNATPDGDKDYRAEGRKIKREAEEGIAEEQNPAVIPKRHLPRRLLDQPGEFDYIKILGEGAFGRVFKVKDKLTEQDFAMKVIDCKETDKVLREAKALSVLLHDNIVRYYSCWLEDFGYAEDSCSSSQSSNGNSVIKYLYIQMELCDAETLRRWIIKRNSQDVKKSQQDSKRRKESLVIAKQIACGIEYVHSKNFIHRDLKPENILFAPDGKVKIGDFGLVTKNVDDVGNPLERTYDKGTPSYMAPEQQESMETYDQKVDIFAMGLIFFELLWKLFTVHEKQAAWNDVRRQKFPQGFLQSFHEEHTIIRKMLCEKPEERVDASELRTDLEECTRRLNAEEIVRRGNRTV